MNYENKDPKIIDKMASRLNEIIEKGMSIEEYIRLVKIILEFIKARAISIDYVSMLFRIIGDAIMMDNFPEELFDIHSNFVAISSDLEIPLTTIEKFTKKIEDLLKMI